MAKKQPRTKSTSKLRKKIDRLDAKLIALLNERATTVVEIGKLKRGQNIPIYAPHREAEVLERVLPPTQGPLPDRTIEGVYREMMSGASRSSSPSASGSWAPPGRTARRGAVKQFGSSVEYEDLHEIGGVFTEVRRGHVNYGLVPIENTTGGGIAEALDAFQEVAGRGVDLRRGADRDPPRAARQLCAEDIRRVYSKPEVFRQCRKWLSEQLPGRT
jgi:chorismate mutase/prephenate dehydratase